MERRREPRGRAFLLGKVLFVTNSLTSDCVVRNLSTTGARIALKGACAYPSDCILVVIKTGMAHETATVWASGDERGLSFRASHPLGLQIPARLNHAYRLWVEGLPR